MRLICVGRFPAMVMLALPLERHEPLSPLAVTIAKLPLTGLVVVVVVVALLIAFALWRGRRRPRS